MSQMLNPTSKHAPEVIPVSALVSSAAFPRVDLLPPAIKEEAKVRTGRIFLGGSVAAAIVLTGGLYLMASSDVSSAQVSMDGATAKSVQLNSEVAKYAAVPLVYGQVDAAQATLQSAMAGDVRWSIVLNALGVSIPAGVSLTGVKITESASPGQPATSSATAGQDQSLSDLGTAGIATINWNGTATTYEAFATFLQSMSQVKVFGDVFARTVAKLDPKSGAVTFETTAIVNNRALSHRYDAKAGR